MRQHGKLLFIWFVKYGWLLKSDAMDGEKRRQRPLPPRVVSGLNTSAAAAAPSAAAATAAPSAAATTKSAPTAIGSSAQTTRAKTTT